VCSSDLLSQIEQILRLEQETGRLRREAGFTDTKSLMASLTQDERAQLYELVELELADDYKKREEKLAQDYESRLRASEAKATQQLILWGEKINEVVAEELKEAASATARLAKQIAEKIVRQQVAIDPEVIARVIETTLFKIVENSPLSLQVNPDDAEWLTSQPDFLNKLNIAQITPDRRIESGGCLVRNSEREWDATLASQLETLDELVAEMITSGSLGVPELPSVEPSAESSTETDAESIETPNQIEVDDVPSVD